MSNTDQKDFDEGERVSTAPAEQQTGRWLLPTWDRKFNWNAVAAVAAVGSACFSCAQAIDASRSSEVAVKAALTSQRMGHCINMAQTLDAARDQASWADVMGKPYSKNDRFLQLTMAVHVAGEEARIFRQMTPGQASERLVNDIFELRIKLKDMIADGSDFLNKEEIRSKINQVAKSRQELCDRMIAPSGGY